MDAIIQHWANHSPMMAYTVLLLISLHVAALAIYRLTWHPLTRFPGPKLAAATGWYETYYDCFLLGKYSNHIDQMHRDYGKYILVEDFVTIC